MRALLATLLAVAAIVGAAGKSVGHPRLMFDETLSELRARTYPDGSYGTWTEREKVSVLARRSILAHAENLLPGTSEDSRWNGQGLQLQGIMVLSMAHLLCNGGEYEEEFEEDEDYDDRYFVKVMELLADWQTDSYWHWAKDPGEDDDDLAEGELAAAWAIAFDWLHDDMDSSQESDNLDALIHFLDVPATFYEESAYALCANDNNHVGIIYGGRGLVALGAAGYTFDAWEIERGDVLEKATERVIAYLDGAFSPSGVGAEGIFYSLYGMNVALPFALAADRDDDGPLVDVAGARNVQQAGTWLAYEQLPHLATTGTPFNDTDLPSTDLNPQPWRSWPWLLAFATPSRPAATMNLFLTHFPRASWDAALAQTFTFPCDSDCDPTELPFSHTTSGVGYQAKNFNPVAILMSWPDESLHEAAFIDPEDLRPARAFEDFGAFFYRTGFHSIDGGGELESDTNGTQIAFQCRNPAPWTNDPYCSDPLWYAQGEWGGHVQCDLNHFTIYSNQEPLFYDSGYRTDSSDGHSVTQYHWTGGDWRGNYVNGDDALEVPGQFLRSIGGQGLAPSMAVGEKKSLLGTELDRDQTHLLIIPRHSRNEPYVMFLHDSDVAGSGSRYYRWLWHAGDNTAFDIDGSSATYEKGDAWAETTILSPSGATLSQETFTPEQWAAHKRLSVESGYRPASDITGIIELGGDGDTPALSASAVASPPAGVFAYTVTDGSKKDIVAVRRGDQTGFWEITVSGKELRSDCDELVLRFNGSSLSWDTINAGLMGNGTAVYFDGMYVMGLVASGSGKGNVTFDSDEVVVETAPAVTLSSYFIGPFVPESAYVNGSYAADVEMTPDVPHWTQLDIPEVLGRSPNNGCVSSPYEYSFNVTLRNWEGTPIEDFDADDARMSILAPAPNPSSNNTPVDDSDEDGVLSWTSGLDTGGSYSSVGSHGKAVKVDLSYNGEDWCTIAALELITSPDADGDNIVDDLDEEFFELAYGDGSGPATHESDLNLDGALSSADGDWFEAHRSETQLISASTSLNGKIKKEGSVYTKNLGTAPFLGKKTGTGSYEYRAFMSFNAGGVSDVVKVELYIDVTAMSQNQPSANSWGIYVGDFYTDPLVDADWSQGTHCLTINWPGGTPADSYHDLGATGLSALSANYYDVRIADLSSHSGTWSTTLSTACKLRLTLECGETLVLNPIGSPSLDETLPHLPARLALESWPQPLHGDGTLRLSMPKTGQAVVEIHDVQGRRVGEIVNERIQAGFHDLAFRPGDLGLDPGVFFVRVVTAGATAETKVVVLSTR